MNLLKEHLSDSGNRLKWLSIVTIIFAILITIIIGISFGSVLTYKNKFYPNTKIGNINISNRSLKQAEEIINKTVANLSDNGILLKTKDGQIRYSLTAFQMSTDPDLAKPLFFIDAQSTVQQAWDKQHQPLSLSQILTTISNTFVGWRFNSVNTTNNEEIANSIQNNFSSTIVSGKPSTINFSTKPPSIITGNSGTEINYQDYSDKIIKQINNLDNKEIIIDTQNSPDPITDDNISDDVRNNLTYLASNTPSLIVSHNNKTIQLPFASYKNWLTVVNNNDEVVLNLDKILATPFWEELKDKINQPLQNARFSIKGGRVKEFQASSNGYTVNIDKTLEIINAQLNNGEIKSFEAPVEIEKATVNNSEVNNLGIDEIIGVGLSNFKGSPKNRRHNIATGAKAIDGLLIAPGEDFSLIKALGTIDSSSGYLQELVIKGNQTKPEYGGGLCQIGTTVFRAALKSGLPIIERRNHSYRVSYYEPAGTDATIYDPKPDFKFKNDTGSHILIQTRISGDELFVEFWGTNDGRKIEQTKPTIYNIVQPGPTQMIETDTLKPGEIKCIETPHAGADAFFDYKVVYPSGEEKSQRFSSHYVPWTKKCLVGTSSTSTPTVSTSTATTTPTNTTTPPSSSTPPINISPTSTTN